MDTAAQSSAQTRKHVWKRGFLPFFVWLPIAALLVATDIHLRLLRNTRAFFTVSVEGHPVQTDYTASIGSVKVLSGQRVLPGWRTFQLAVANAQPVKQKFFIWYGSNYLGDFNLAAYKGTVEISADPPPIDLQISGPWFSALTKQSPAVFSAVPVGQYTVTARYRWTREERRIDVRRGETSQLTIHSDLGSLDLTAQPPDAQFRLASLQHYQVVVTNRTPAQLSHLPSGEYQLRVWRGDYLKEANFEIKRGETNHLTVAFEYGQVQLISDPAGATVYSGTQAIGTTPKVFTTLKPGRYRFRLEHEGYEPAQVSFDITGTEPLTVRTNLVNLRYKTAMQKARRLAAAWHPDYEQALTNVAEALHVQPGDADALSLKSQLEASRQKQQAQVAEQEQRAEWNRRRKLASQRFKELTDAVKDSDLFDTHHWTVKGTQATVREALLRTFAKGPQHPWTVEKETMEDDGRLVFQCKGNTSTQSKRNCVVMAWQTGPNETQVYAKFWDYFSAGLLSALLSGGKEDGKWIPVNASRVTRDQVRNVQERRRVLPEEFGKILQTELH